MSLNLPLIDLDSFINNRKRVNGGYLNTNTLLSSPREAKHVLVVDDTILSGKSLNHARSLIDGASINQNVTYCTIYAEPRSVHKCDICLEVLQSPRAFEWNIMHNAKIGDFCLEIEGVLCLRPTAEETDDGPAYRHYLKNAKPLLIPSLKVGYIITNRLEKYRKETEEWLRKYKIQYKALHMFDKPVTKTRRPKAITSHKARLFKDYRESRLLINGEQDQSNEIANITGKPVLCVANQKLYSPRISVALLNERLRGYQNWASLQAEKAARRILREKQSKQEQVYIDQN